MNRESVAPTESLKHSPPLLLPQQKSDSNSKKKHINTRPRADQVSHQCHRRGTTIIRGTTDLNFPRPTSDVWSLSASSFSFTDLFFASCPSSSLASFFLPPRRSAVVSGPFFPPSPLSQINDMPAPVFPPLRTITLGNRPIIPFSVVQVVQAVNSREKGALWKRGKSSLNIQSVCTHNSSSRAAEEALPGESIAYYSRGEKRGGGGGKSGEGGRLRDKKYWGHGQKKRLHLDFFLLPSPSPSSSFLFPRSSGPHRQYTVHFRTVVRLPECQGLFQIPSSAPSARRQNKTCCTSSIKALIGISRLGEFGSRKRPGEERRRRRDRKKSWGKKEEEEGKASGSQPAQFPFPPSYEKKGKEKVLFLLPGLRRH